MNDTEKNAIESELKLAINVPYYQQLSVKFL